MGISPLSLSAIWLSGDNAKFLINPITAYEDTPDGNHGYNVQTHNQTLMSGHRAMGDFKIAAKAVIPL